MDPYNQMSVLSTFFPSTYKPIECPLHDYEVFQEFGLLPMHAAFFRCKTRPFKETPREIPLPQNIGYLGKDQQFSVFNPEHMEEAAVVYNFLLSLPSFDDVAKISEQLRKKLNADLFYHAYSIAARNRPEAKAMLPALWEYKPRCVFTQLQIKQALEKADKERESEEPKLYVTGTVHDQEFQLAWWREDHQLNAHHLHWHQVYPWAGINGKTKDREGELFYYMHQQMLARYDAERLAVGLPRVEPFSNWNLPIQKVDNFSKGPELVPVDINLLGAAVESSIDSPNKDLYGNLHNMGHMMIAAAVDPDGRYKLDVGVMGDIQTAIRDPIFFRWHRFIDELFFLHKIKLPPYTKEELAFDDICINSVNVQVDKQSAKKTASGGITKQPQPNVLTTYSEKNDIDITRAINDPKDVKAPGRRVLVTVQQLNHPEFSYAISYENKRDVQVKAVFRIFLAPTKNEHGKTLPFEEQRRLFIEMDKFVEILKPGRHQIQPRSSKDSSLTIPPPKPVEELTSMASFRHKQHITKCDSCREQLNAHRLHHLAGCHVLCNLTWPKLMDETTSKLDDYCECGWPHHMLLPRGRVGSGMTFDLFVMVTDWKEDSVTGNLDRGTSYCGLRSAKYPDKRAMGFPFDRPFRERSVDDLVNDAPNMRKVQITIQHEPNQ